LHSHVTRKRQRPGLPLLIAGLLLLACVPALLALSACGGESSSSPRASASPQPAASAAVLPGLSADDFAKDPSAYKEVAGRVINVFLEDGSSRKERAAMAERIAAMPEVVAYHYVTKAEALKRFAAYSERIAKVTENLPINPLPASFEILVREGEDVTVVARRFYDDPLAFNDPGTHNGVSIGARIPGPVESASP
jgi:hypothetical protein